MQIAKSNHLGKALEAIEWAAGTYLQILLACAAGMVSLSIGLFLFRKIKDGITKTA